MIAKVETMFGPSAIKVQIGLTTHNTVIWLLSKIADDGRQRGQQPDYLLSNIARVNVRSPICRR